MVDEAAVVWFRRDLRLGDHPALLSAASHATRALALFVLDQSLLGPAGAPRRTFLFECLRALDSALDGRLLVVRGDPADVLPRVVNAVGARSVHVSADAGPYGRKRDVAVEKTLGDVMFVRSGSPYAVTPGRVRTSSGSPFQVFTPFYRAWSEHGWRAPADTSPSTVDWIGPSESDSEFHAVRIPDSPEMPGMDLPPAGESAALKAWKSFRVNHLANYSDQRDRIDVDATSRISAYLRWGCIHPRTLLAGLDESSGAEAYRRELAFREFYADVLWHRPESARRNFDRRFDRMRHDSDKAGFDAWAEGRTGYPIVDAGMRQLRAEGWMHNRLRMIVASFLVKDLHLPWWWGARHFMRYLVDGDLASNQHNWQWVAGSGTDAAPYFRVFNPLTQAEKFDPSGDYVRRYLPELANVGGKKVHRPWDLPDGPPHGYPHPIVDHTQERHVALERYQAIRG